MNYLPVKKVVVHLLVFVNLHLRQSCDCSSEGGDDGGDGRSDRPPACNTKGEKGKARNDELFRSVSKEVTYLPSIVFHAELINVNIFATHRRFLAPFLL